MEFPAEIQAASFRRGGEYAWQRAGALRAVEWLAAHGLAVLGGELWMVLGSELWGVLPQRAGPPGVYHWEAVREANERWAEYARRSCREAAAAIAALPDEGEIALPPGAAVYYNLVWAKADE